MTACEIAWPLLILACCWGALMTALCWYLDRKTAGLICRNCRLEKQLDDLLVHGRAPERVDYGRTLNDALRRTDPRRLHLW